MKIVILKEWCDNELCVVVIFEIVKKFIVLGLIVVVEMGVGEGLYIVDEVYKEVGVFIGIFLLDMVDGVDFVFKVMLLMDEEIKVLLFGFLFVVIFLLY